MSQENAAPNVSAQAATVEHAHPGGSVLDQIIDQTRAAKVAESKPLVQKGVRALLREVLEANKKTSDPEKKLRVDRLAVDQAIAKLDERLGQQLDKILHSEQFQKLESSWRGLKFLVERTDFRENNRVSVLNVSKADLASDFEYANELFQSGLYYHVHKAEYGQFGGKPYGAIIANYDFAPTSPDIKLMRFVAGVARMAHAPFIAAAGPQFFGLDSYEGLPRLKDIHAAFEGKQYIGWRSFRDSEDSRYLGLTMPRFLMRLPYHPESNPIKSFNYSEKTGKHSDFLWGNTAFAFATRLTESFAKYRWCPNIIGPQGGGTVEQLPVHLFKSPDGDLEQKIPTEVLIPEVSEYELSEEGFIALTMRKDSDNACFFSANSVRKPQKFPNTPEGQAAETNERLGMQLPYLFVVSRLAHYIKVLQREALGTDKEKKDLQNDLEKWIKQYVTDDDNPQPGIRAQRPLRSAVIKVEDVAGRPGWYSVSIKVRPHFKFMGASFELSLVGQQGPPGK